MHPRIIFTNRNRKGVLRGALAAPRPTAPPPAQPSEPLSDLERRRREQAAAQLQQ